eukprot:6610979-Prymnesium_polylepis.1
MRVRDIVLRSLGRVVQFWVLWRPERTAPRVSDPCGADFQGTRMTSPSMWEDEPYPFLFKITPRLGA